MSKRQAASYRVVWQYTTITGPYANEISEFGVSLGVRKHDGDAPDALPQYIGRSGEAQHAAGFQPATKGQIAAGFEVALDDGLGQLDIDTQSELLEAAYNLHTAFKVNVPSSARLTKIRLFPVRQDGYRSVGEDNYRVASTDYLVNFANSAGTGPTQMPPEVAMAISFYGLGRSRKSRGRAFMGPLCKEAFENTGVIAQNTLAAMADAWSDFLAYANALTIGPDGEKFLAWTHNPTPAPVVGAHPPVGSPIVAIRYDDRPDSQRRRQNRYKPVKASLPITAW